MNRMVRTSFPVLWMVYLAVLVILVSSVHYLSCRRSSNDLRPRIALATKTSLFRDKDCLEDDHEMCTRNTARNQAGNSSTAVCSAGPMSVSITSLTITLSGSLTTLWQNLQWCSNLRSRFLQVITHDRFRYLMKVGGSGESL
jgi:hypothetical protein